MTSPFEPPQRKALTDGELAEKLEKLQAAGGALEALEFLQTQNQLRAADEIAFVAWVKQMEADGSPEAVAALGQARAGATGISIETSILEPELKSTLEGDLAALGDWQARAAEAEAKRLEAERLEAERIAAEQAELERLEAERLEAERVEAERIAAEQAELERLEAERIAAEQAELERLEAERLEIERLELEKLAAELAELERLEAERLEAERLEAERVEAERIEAERVAAEVMTESEPMKAVDFATGGFDIVETAQVTVVEEVDAATFEKLLTSDELSFQEESKKPKQPKTPISEVARRSKAISQLFVWSGVTVGVIPMAIGAVVAKTGLPFSWLLIALVAGFAFSAAIVASGAVAGKRSGLQTLMLSRASLGVRAGSGVAIPVFIAKILIGTVTVAALGKELFDGTVAGLPALGESLSGLSVPISWLEVMAALLFLVAAIFATLGGKVLYWLQFGAGVLGLVAVVSVSAAAIALPAVQLDWNLSVPGEQIAIALGIAGVIGAALGAVWTASVADFTRQVPMSESGKKVALFVALGIGVVALLAAISGAVIFSASKTEASAGAVITMISGLQPWAASVVLFGGAVQLLVWAASWLYSSSVSLRGLGIRVGRVVGQLLVLLLVLVTLVVGSTIEAATLRASSLIALVILMAFAGVFVADVWRRKAAYHETSLREAFGFYGAVNWLNLSSFLVAIVIGLGFVSTSLDHYFVTNFIGQYLTAIDFKDAQAGLFFAFVIAAVIPAAFGGKRIRAQEQKVHEVEARRGTFDAIDLGEL